MSEQLSGPAALLSDALARLGVVQHQHNELVGQVADVAGSVAEVVERQDGVEETVRVLVERLDQHFGTTTDDEDDSDLRQVNWVVLDRVQAVVEWDRLYAWVEDVLIGQYSITRRQLPDCWTYHADIRNNLSWLRVSWCQAIGAEAPAGLLADWHLRQLSGALEIIGAAKNRTKCGAGKHGGEKLSADQEAPDEDILADPACWVSEGREKDIEARPEPPPPAIE